MRVARVRARFPRPPAGCWAKAPTAWRSWRPLPPRNWIWHWAGQMWYMLPCSLARPATGFSRATAASNAFGPTVRAGGDDGVRGRAKRALWTFRARVAFRAAKLGTTNELEFCRTKVLPRSEAG